MDEFKRIQSIMEKHGATCSLEEFHAAVNVTFHQFESEVYDEIHQDMWRSLPRQVELLASDCLSKHPSLPESLAVLDIGCGTGLASDCLLKTPIGKRVRSIDLLDTSPAMLSRVSQRAPSWGVPFRHTEGLIDAVAGNRYEFIIASSVLHHVPDLRPFLRSVRDLQPSGGVFLHLQDPNGDYLDDPELKQRRELTQDHRPQWLQRLQPSRVWGRLKREITGEQGKDYISKAIRTLVEKGVVREPLSVRELFSITDIHVVDEQGISIRELAFLLPEYELMNQRSYGFFGELASKLPPALRRTEDELIAKNALNGFHVGAVWCVRS